MDGQKSGTAPFSARLTGDPRPPPDRPCIRRRLRQTRRREGTACRGHLLRGFEGANGRKTRPSLAPLPDVRRKPGDHGRRRDRQSYLLGRSTGKGHSGTTPCTPSGRIRRAPRTLTYSFKVLRRERVTKDIPASELPFSKAEFRKELAATRLADLERSGEGVWRRRSPPAERRTGRKHSQSTIGPWRTCSAIPTPRGAASADVDMLVRTLGGKCGDIHSVYTALARVSGVPSREVWGIRIPSGVAGRHDESASTAGRSGIRPGTAGSWSTPPTSGRRSWRKRSPWSRPNRCGNTTSARWTRAGSPSAREGT